MKEANEIELKELVARVARHQGTQSDNKFCERFGKYIGTPRMWRSRLLAGTFDLDVPKRIDLLKELVSYIEGGEISEDFYELPFHKSFLQGMEKLESQFTTDRRIFCVLGAIGVGKTMSCKAVLRDSLKPGRIGPKRVLFTIPEALRENKFGLIAAMAARLGCGTTAPGAPAQMEALVSFLSGSEITVLIDEGHQGGVMLMRILKDLVNLTRGRFVYVALGTEYTRVVSATKGGIIEAKQFLRRCIQPVFNHYADGTKVKVGAAAADASILIQKKAGLCESDASRVGAACLGLLRQNGNLSTLADAIELAQEDAEEHDKPFNAQLLEDHIKELCQ